MHLFFSGQEVFPFLSLQLQLVKVCKKGEVSGLWILVIGHLDRMEKCGLVDMTPAQQTKGLGWSQGSAILRKFDD